MESMEVAHRDIKLENILIDDENVVKIGDFGSAILEPHDSATTTPVGTQVFWPPEYKHEPGATPVGSQLGHVEIWLLGTVLLELVQAPYAPGKKHRAYKKRARARVQSQRPAGWSEGAWRACRQLIFACRQPDPANRPTIRTVAANTWLFPDQDGF
ncbi:kinase-like protein [Auricularia subglabra TFB-10046 SS5]|nr:kinase-like protein [Auricularia subglabra TFB-10046 SS5]